MVNGNVINKTNAVLLMEYQNVAIIGKDAFLLKDHILEDIIVNEYILEIIVYIIIIKI